MAHYNSKYLKRHYIFANSTAACLLNKGRLLMSRKRRRSTTTRHFHDSKGKQCWQGKGDLKDSEPLVRIKPYRTLPPNLTLEESLLRGFKEYDIKVGGTLSKEASTRFRYQPRQYPVNFAIEYLRICQQMKQKRKGFPPEDGVVPDALTSVATLPLGQEDVDEFFTFADLNQVYVYLRGCRKLKIPDVWRSIVPPTISLH